MKGLGESLMIVWASFGLEIEHAEETVDKLSVYISVPEFSYETKSDGTEMAGMVLAKSFKRTLSDMGVKRLVVKARIRAGEMWTKQMAEAAKTKMKQTIFKSQW